MEGGDGEAIVQALKDAEANPVVRQLGRLGKADKTTPARPPSFDDVVIPEDEPEVPEEAKREGSIHTEIQYLLLKLGADMGFDVHVASNEGTKSQPEVQTEPHGQQEHRAGHHNEHAQPRRARPVLQREPHYSRPSRLGRGLGPGLPGDSLTRRGHRVFLEHVEEDTALPDR